MQVSNVMEALLHPGLRARRGPARAHVYVALRDAIVTADLEPGRQLSENELAARLGVSRTPVREALQRLREERLVARPRCARPPPTSPRWRRSSRARSRPARRRTSTASTCSTTSCTACCATSAGG